MNQKILKNLFFIVFIAGSGFTLFNLFSSKSDKLTNNSVTQKDTPKTLFTLLDSKDTGVKFINSMPVDISKGEDVLTYQYYYNGAGVAIGDINNDGLPDIYFAANKSSNRLYLNQGDMNFKDITFSAKVGSKKYSTGVVFVDINNDGYLDIYICNGGNNSDSKERENQLYINNGDLTFSEKAKEYGLNDSNYSSQAAFFDYDLDGDLDVYVMNHSIHFKTPIPKVIEMSRNKEFVKSASGKLFKNSNGRFIDVTDQMGLLKYSFGLGLCISDINQDGWPDIYVANDFSVPDFLLINNQGKGFIDQVKQNTNQISWFGMGADIADINNDGFLDIAVLDMAAADHFRSKTLMATMDPKAINYMTNNLGFHHQYMFNSIQLNNGGGYFSNIANLTKTAKTDWSWAALLADFDNDGNKDYFITNGFRKCTLDNDFQIELKEFNAEYKDRPKPISRANQLYHKMPEIKLPNYLFHNKGDLNFEDVAAEWGLGKSSYSNGASYADLYLDGDLDLVINNVDQVASIYRNNTDTDKNKFLRINLVDKNNSSGFYNALVRIYYDDQQQVVEYSPTRGYLSSVEHILHFGIPDHINKIDQVVVTLFNQNQIIKKDIDINQTLDIAINNARKGSDQNSTIKPYFKELDSELIGVDFKHTENDFDDFEYEGLLPHRQSRFGPFCSVADVNGDGLDDFFVGAAAGQSASLYLQSKNGNFYLARSQPWDEDRGSEDMNSLFFDIDNDQDLDLYVVSGGGGEFEISSPLLQDRIYINDGAGNFSRDYDAFADDIFESGQQVKAADIDLDGDLDLFVGGRLIPGYYPYSPKSYVLINEEGVLYNGNDYWGYEIEDKGLITDFLFTDFDLDGQMDLILVGEWTSIYMLKNDGVQFIDVSSNYGTDQLKGWWYSIEESDFNGDNRPDYLVGNIGLNTKFKASDDKPFHINTNDFDDDNDQDIVLSTYYKGDLVPIRGRECSSGEMPFIKEKYPTFEGFANATLEELYTEEKLETSIHLEVNTFASIALLSESEGYSVVDLPMNAQVSPINRFIVEDFDNDGYKDIILGGNMFHTEVETPRYDSGVGLMMKVDQNGTFLPIHPMYSGVFLNKDVKDIDPITIGNQRSFLVCNNNDKIQVFVPNN